MDLLVSLVIASILIACVLILRIWEGPEPSFFKLLFSLVVLVPFIGPVAYLWIANWPTKNPWWLDGSRAGHARGYLDDQLSHRGGGESFDQYARDVLFNSWVRGKLPKKRSTLPPRKRRLKREPTRLSPGWYFAGLVIGALLLANSWLNFFVMYRAGNVWGYKNYWGADVGIFLLLAVLIAATPAYVVAAWRYWPENRKERK